MATQIQQAPKPPYRSPDGTWECILKSVLEDPALTNAEFRLLLYLATKPPGWEIHVSHLVQVLERTRYEVTKALTGLRRQGYVVDRAARDETGKVESWAAGLRRELVLHLAGDESAQVVPTEQESVPVELTSVNGASAQVTSTEQDYHSLVIQPHREDSVSSDYSPDQSESPGGEPAPDNRPWLVVGHRRCILGQAPAQMPSAAPDVPGSPRPPGSVGRVMAETAVDRMYPGTDPAAVVAAVAEFLETVDRPGVRSPKAYIEASRASLTPLVHKHAGYAAELRRQDERRQARQEQIEASAEASRADAARWQMAEASPCSRCGDAAGQPKLGTKCRACITAPPTPEELAELGAAFGSSWPVAQATAIGVPAQEDASEFGKTREVPDGGRGGDPAGALGAGAG
jgi:MarR family